MGQRGEVFSRRLSSNNERRTYFFNVKENRGGDVYLSIVESKKQESLDFDRHQIVVFDDDIDAFERELTGVLGEIRRLQRERRSRSRARSASDTPKDEVHESRPPKPRSTGKIRVVRSRKREDGTSDGE